LPVAGGHWTYFTLARSLTRAALAGKLMQKGTDMGTLANVEPVVTQEDWERPAPQHPLSSLIMCECGRSRLLATVRSGRATYEDGSPRREYRCRRREDLPERMRGCGRNVIDARAAEAAVYAAMVERLSDPRSAERLAAHCGQVRAERTRIEADIAQWNEAADRLALKTARWGQDRVDKAMEPILAEIDSLQAELAKLDDEPAGSPAGTEEAVAQWREAVESGDIAAQRTRHTTLTWVERNFGYAVARAYAGHEGGLAGAGVTATYVRADLDEVAAALSALTAEHGLRDVRPRSGGG
jgi:hypothetical protein